MRKLLLAVYVVVICCVITVLAWTKSPGITAVIPYFPHRRKTSQGASGRTAVQDEIAVTQ